MQLNKIYNEDCLEGMKRIPDGSVDMILCDLPYGTTACKWDNIIPFEPLWEQYNRIIKDNGAIVLFGNEPFSSKLRMSNLKNYKYDWIYVKSQAQNFLNAKKQPLRNNETISVFYKKQCTYNPQMRKGKPYKCTKGKSSKSISNDENITNGGHLTQNYGTRYPLSVMNKFNIETGLHPTQKPVALLEYLVKTYTNENETVLDNCMGSGTTAIACINTNRKYIGFELDKHYCDIANERIQKALAEKEVQND